ncbi:MAG: hypothetical protein U0841_32050 [Chloroflexia bacterium]
MTRARPPTIRPAKGEEAAAEDEELEAGAEDGEEGQADQHQALAFAHHGGDAVAVPGDLEADADGGRDQRPAIGPGLEAAGEVLDEEHQADGGDDAARDGEAARAATADEHAGEEEHARADDEEGPAVASGVEGEEVLREEEGSERHQDRAAEDAAARFVRSHPLVHHSFLSLVSRPVPFR